jgi:hypothetical protein
MRNDGTSLEYFVRDVERACIDDGFEVEVRVKEYLDSNRQCAEFDVLVTGKVGSNKSYRGLLQCRDRPSEGRQGPGWIREVAGTRDEFRFSHAAAVSTTGFTEAAYAAAQNLNVELRTVDDIDPNSVVSWLANPQTMMRQVIKERGPTKITLLPDASLTPELYEKFSAAIADARSSDPILRSSETGNLTTPTLAVVNAITEDVFDKFAPQEEPIEARFLFEYPASHYLVDTEAGPIRIAAIDAEVQLRSVVSTMPLVALRRYSRASDGREVIAEQASYSFRVAGGAFELKLQRNEDGTTHLLVVKS